MLASYMKFGKDLFTLTWIVRQCVQSDKKPAQGWPVNRLKLILMTGDPHDLKVSNFATNGEASEAGPKLVSTIIAFRIKKLIIVMKG